ncbi:hypothetical protein B0H14DRAFT_3861278 [Mycena olivaceomarginata]|nr:hypothetical protein B0H14DRAFT_3861278 [Mycena olivaceomarginata]
MSVLRRVQAAQSVWVTNQALLFLFRHDDQRQAYLGGPQIVTDNKTSVSPPPSIDRVVGLDMRAPSSLTFGSRSSDASVEDTATLRARMAGGLPPVFTRHSRNRSSLLPDAPTPRPPQRQVVDHFPAALVRVWMIAGRDERLEPARRYCSWGGAFFVGVFCAVKVLRFSGYQRTVQMYTLASSSASQNGPSQTRAHTPGPWRAARRARPIRDDFDSPHIGRRRRALDTPHTAGRRSRRPLLRTLLATFPATPLCPHSPPCSSPSCRWRSRLRSTPPSPSSPRTPPQYCYIVCLQDNGHDPSSCMYEHNPVSGGELYTHASIPSLFTSLSLLSWRWDEES